MDQAGTRGRRQCWPCLARPWLTWTTGRRHEHAKSSCRGSTVQVMGGPHCGAAGTVIRARTDAQVEIRLLNKRVVLVELYHLNT